MDLITIGYFIIVVILIIFCSVYYTKWKKSEETLTSERKSHATGLNTQRSVVKGQAYENIANLFPDFKHVPSNCRSMGDPIDYIVFDNLENEEKPVDIVIVEVKSGKSQLNKNQKRIKEACESKRVSFETYRIDESKFDN